MTVRLYVADNHVVLLPIFSWYLQEWQLGTEFACGAAP